MKEEIQIELMAIALYESAGRWNAELGGASDVYPAWTWAKPPQKEEWRKKAREHISSLFREME